MSFNVLIIFISLIINNINTAPTSTSNHPHILYDQKQTGDLNILVHLKDFQFISVLGGEDLFDGDYDYSYDENDFTVKPTRKTTTTTTTTTSKPTTTIAISSIENKPLLTTNQSVDNNTNNNSSDESELSSTPFSSNKIKVHILGSPSVGIVPSNDDFDNDGIVASDTVLTGEELSRKKCADGYSRDKKGRCRRVRKPVGDLSYSSSVIPSNILSKLTSNLATKLRLKNNAAATNLSNTH